MMIQVRQYLMEGKRQDLTCQAIINLTDEALWNLMSACSNTGKSSVAWLSGVRFTMQIHAVLSNWHYLSRI